jgi:glutamate 5-kinase
MAKVVVKVGSAVLSQNNELALDRLQNLVEFLCELSKKNDIILVSSGAVSAGYTLLPLDINIVENKQVLAALGQPLLMKSYKQYFQEQGILCAQVLLEANDFTNEKTLNNIKRSMNIMMENNIIPIVNENDVTAIEELVFGDNDQLASHVTYHVNADMLVILTDIDGYYDSNPHENYNAILLKHISSISEEELNAKHSSNNDFATGGIVTKLKAANFLLKKNIPMFLTTGFDLQFVRKYLLDGVHDKGTLFKNK